MLPFHLLMQAFEVLVGSHQPSYDSLECLVSFVGQWPFPTIEKARNWWSSHGPIIMLKLRPPFELRLLRLGLNSKPMETFESVSRACSPFSLWEVLYLGGASGTTVSHVSDMVGPEGAPRTHFHGVGPGPGLHGHGSKARLAPVNIPIPTKIGSKMDGEFSYQPKWDPIGFDPQPHLQRECKLWNSGNSSFPLGRLPGALLGQPGNLHAFGRVFGKAEIANIWLVPFLLRLVHGQFGRDMGDSLNLHQNGGGRSFFIVCCESRIFSRTCELQLSCAAKPNLDHRWSMLWSSLTARAGT